MAEFWKIVKSLARSPLFFAYWLVVSAGAIGNFYNSGSTGSFWLGATVIGLFLMEFVFFYWQLNRTRNENGFSNPRNGMKLFFSLTAYRICLLVFLSPVIALIAWSRSTKFNQIAQIYVLFEGSTPEERLFYIGRIAEICWPIALGYFCFIAIEQAGRSYVVAKGISKKAIQKTVPSLMLLALPIIGFTIAEIILTALRYGNMFLDSAMLPKAIVPISAILLSPLFFLLEAGTMIAMAKRLKRKMPELS